MVTITEAAREKIVELIDASETKVKGLRLGAKAVSPLKTDFKMAFMAHDQDTGDDTVIEFDGFNVYIDAASQPSAEDAKEGEQEEEEEAEETIEVNWTLAEARRTVVFWTTSCSIAQLSLTCAAPPPSALITELTLI